MQGRTVGGSTTVNWTSSFRTPPETLAFWQQNYGVTGCSGDEMAPWFAQMERRLHISTWTEPPNENNGVLASGAAVLGIETRAIPRNVKSCANLGYCGMGCPTNAKQSMLVTTIPEALKRGADLFTRARAERFTFSGGRISGLQCRALLTDGITPGPHTLTLRARHYICAAGAIGTPALLMRSGAPDPNGLAGTRTFLHPVVLSAALMPQPVNAFSGAPQSVYSDHFLHTQPISGPVGFKLEVPPVHPVLAATTLVGFGPEHARLMDRLPYVQVIIALMRDGFHDHSPGGVVQLQSDGTPVLDYPMTGYLWEGARRALETMANIQFAAGARAVLPLHEDAVQYGSLGEAHDAIQRLPMEILRTRVVSAHVMGGFAMGEDPNRALLDSYGSHRYVPNLSVFDGSIFPTSLGTNPQLSIYGFTARNATLLSHRLSF